MDEARNGISPPSEVLASLSVPPGVSVLANLSFYFHFGTGPQAQGAPVPQFNGLPGQSGLGFYDQGHAGQIILRANTSRQIRHRCSASGSGYPQIRIATLGWWDRRGKDE